ncbi:MAG TPA: EAL domain-containing protein [Thermoanaerobaculia bacterium]|nr:EAL domain-containing protein [Thermoanaerobaculia bacterium]
MTEHVRFAALPEMERRRRQQQAVAELGQAALARVDPEILLGQTCALVEAVLQVAHCSIVERKGSEWRTSFAIGENECGDAHPAHVALFLYALVSDEAVAFNNLVADPRADGAHFANVHDLHAGVVTRIGEPEHPFGVLVALDDRDREFALDEVEFLEAIANLTAAMLERGRVDRELAQTQQRFRSLVENSSDGILLVNDRGVIEYASPSTVRLLGRPDSELVAAKLTSLLHPDDVVKVNRNHSQLLTAFATSVHDEIRVKHANGSFRYMEAVAQNLLNDTAVNAIVINYRDITERRQAEQQLEHLAYHDTLTDLPNRFLFGDRLRHAVDQARRRQRGLAVLYLDLDRFKLVNDTLGHATGDHLLQAVARRLCDVVRTDDTVARLGGDEFALLLVDIEQPEDAGRVGTKLLESLRAPLAVGEHQLYATGSVGISIFPTDAEDAAGLLRNADAALYRAKELGRNNVQLFATSMNERYRKRLDIEQRLRRAIECDEFVLHYQPIVDSSSETIRTVEALVRWRLPDGRIAPPGEFISVAEETGLILPIGEWVLARACADLAEWRRSGMPELRVAVNLSAHQIQQRQFVSFVADTITHAGLPPQAIELEVTESTAMQNLQWSLSVLDQLHSFGVRIAVDDFGTGQSSLAYLKRFPLHTLKIDREFLHDMRGPSDAAILGSIIALGRSLGLYVVAEGIETAEELELLRHDSCDGLQGYLLGVPMPATEVPAFLRNFRFPADGVMNGNVRAAAAAHR